MKRIAERTDQELKWVQPSTFKMAYELRSGEEVVAALRFRSAFGSLATAESLDGCWTFKRVGFFQTRATIRLCGTEQELAVFRNNTWSSGGTLEFPGGSKLQATTNIWQTNLEFRGEDGELLVRFKSGGLIHLSAQVVIPAQAAGRPELPLLVLFGWYLTVMMHQDSAATTAATTAAIH
jgi:hypothetical protein